MQKNDVTSAVLQAAVAFTGKLACMTRAEAFEVVRQKGGTPSDGVSKRTKALIVGELGWPLLDDGKPSKKLATASSYGIPIISERRFLEWIGKAAPDTLTRTYSPDQIAALSGLSRNRIEDLVRLGILDEREGLFGFRELAAARQVAKLLSDGVSLSGLIKSLHQIRKWLPDAGLANLRLATEGESLVIDQAQGRTNTKGQFILDVDASSFDPEAHFRQAQAAEEAGDLVEAERHYRAMMKVDASDAASAFNLGNLLQCSGRKVEAEAAFRKAVSVNPRFAEAWYNLSDLLDDQGRTSDAIHCLLTAVKVAPDYADALFNLALLLQRSDRHTEAIKYWREYLSKDSLSEWASRARRSLKYCEMYATELKRTGN